eukprot:364439-Chlamydomonas_euryale.AAC.14
MSTSAPLRRWQTMDAARRLEADAREQLLGVVAHLHILLLAPDVEDEPDFLFRVRLGRDDEQAVEQIDRDSVGRLVLRAADLRDAAVRRNHEHRRHVVLERAIEEREALNVEHVHLVDEEHARDNLRLALLAPLRHLLVNLLADLVPDLARIAGEQRQEALRHENTYTKTEHAVVFLLLCRIQSQGSIFFGIE